MRVLCVYFNYPQLSATYIEAEIRYFLRKGIEVAVWAETDPGSPYEPPCPVYRGTLSDAESAFNPDVIHFYWLKMLAKYYSSTICACITARSHSYEVLPDQVAYFQQQDRIKQLFLFPHHGEQLFSLDKVISIPVAYDNRRYPLAIDPTKRSDLVVCATAGLPGKDLETFFEVALRCDNHQFILVLATCTGHDATIDHCLALNRELGHPVEVHVDLPHSQVVPLIRQAGTYLCTQRPTKMGMPIAITEALASGCYVVAPRLTWLSAMLGQFGDDYVHAAEAAEHIYAASRWSQRRWDQFRDGAARYAAQHYSADVVLPHVLAVWEKMLEETC